MKILNKKPAGKPGTEMTKLKDFWLSLPDDDRAGWQEFFSSKVTTADIRQEISARLNIHLKQDSQWCRFRDWELSQRAREVEAERVEDDYRQLLEEFGDKWTLDQIQEEVFRRGYARALAAGDFKLAFATMREEVRLQRVALEERRVILLEQKAAAREPVEEVSKLRLTPEENRRRLREILK